MNFIQNLKSLPVSTKRLLGLGVVLALVLALPLFIWAIITQRFELREKAATGEPENTIVCSDGLSDNFEGASIDLDKWSATNQVVQSDGTIVISGLAQEEADHYLISNKWVDGDFQAEVDINEFIAVTQVDNDLATVELKAYGDSGNYYSVRWVKWANGNSKANVYSSMQGIVTQGYGTVINSDAAPRLKLVRESLTIRGYFDIGNGFVELPGLDVPAYWGVNKIMLYSYKRGAETTQGTFDNFWLGCIDETVPTPTPTTPAVGGTDQTPTPTPTQGEPNFCGGTCGSNYNCQGGYFCFEGYCRNPLCKDDSDCDCKTPTPKPTTKPKTTLKPSPTTEVIYLNSLKSSSPLPTIPSRFTPTPSAVPTSVPVLSGSRLGFLLYIAAGSLGTALLLIIANALRRK